METSNFIYIVELVTFTCGIKIYVLTITQYVITLTVADIIIQTGAHFR